MVQLEDGWPLGLRLMNARVGLAGNHHYLSALFSFNTLRTHSPSSFTDFSSDLDTELQCCLNRLPKREPEDQMENLFRMRSCLGQTNRGIRLAATFSLFTAKLVNYI
ncbi:uncharacterized protein LOC111801130 isoform X3 [Cucurbita pepo subsp. pepo]|uniref:uncharacterized protein LOC111801130 isoform X3 n=1 Tax=Cucurbita pepo subsp. pepo TaxID=3664 RepID=UPI000C9D65B3|nr:uncharacterized protein LOC111801130 isoform X3 [Cucurbita pepo subsp. pepo]